MTTFNACDYWPQLASGTTLTNMYSSGIVNAYTSDVYGNVCLRQTINGKWDSDWYYRIDAKRGVLEYRDDYPKKWYNYLEFWKPTREVWCVPGWEIVWGGLETVGSTIFRECETAGLFGQLGTQKLTFEAILPTFTTPAGTFKDVLVQTYWQQWGGGKIDGAKMWLVPGIGQLRAEWLENGLPGRYWMELLKTGERQK